MHQGKIIRSSSTSGRPAAEPTTGSDHVLPIGTERDMPDPDHVALARPLEGQDVVAASGPFRRIWVEFLLAAVEAGLDDFLHAASGQEIS